MRATALIAALVSFSAAAAANGQEQEQVINGRGTVITQSPAFLLPDANRTPLKVLPVGTSVVVLTRQRDWYQIIFYDSPLGDRTAHIRVANVRLEPAAPAPRSPAPPVPPPASTPPRTPTPRERPVPGKPAQPRAASTQRTPRSTSSWLSRAYVSLNGNYQTTSTGFTDVATFRRYAETGTTTASYAVGRAPGLDIGGGVRVWRELEIGAAVTRMVQSRDGTVAARIPHPFFFNQFRDVSGTASLTRQELVVHGDLTWEIELSRKTQVGLFGGPSYFRVQQGLITDVSVTDLYPFDSATFSSATTIEPTVSEIGFNAGIDFSTFFSQTFGVGILARYSRAPITFSASGSNVTVDAGGLQVGAGIRLRF